MAPPHTRWTIRVHTRREFLELGMTAAAWAGLAACSSADLGSSQQTGGLPQNGGKPTQDAGAAQPDASAPIDLNQPVTAYGPITPNARFYITSCCDNPVVDANTWALSIQNRGVNIASVDYATLRSMPARNKEHTLECISAGPAYLAISNAIWTGLPLTEVFDKRGVKVPSGTLELVFRSVDGYSASLPVEDLQKPIWLVWLMNGVELPKEHGFPVRLLVPGRYGMKNPKWITSIDFVDEPFTGYWDQMGWSKEAPYLTNTLIHVPSDDVPAGAVVAHGTAFAGSDPILAVEVSLDGGSWHPAVIDYSPGPDIWTLWHYDMVLTPGSHQLQARCTTQSGLRSSPSTTATDYLAGYDGSELVTFNVT